MKKRKKNVKGLTLIEIIVSLAIFAILSALLVSASSSTGFMMRKTNRLNEKIAIEAPGAAARNCPPKATDPVSTEPEKSTMSLTIGDKTSIIEGEIHEAEATDPPGMPNGYYDVGGDFRYFSNPSVVQNVSP